MFMRRFSCRPILREKFEQDEYGEAYWAIMSFIQIFQDLDIITSKELEEIDIIISNACNSM